MATSLVGKTITQRYIAASAPSLKTENIASPAQSSICFAQSSFFNADRQKLTAAIPLQTDRQSPAGSYQLAVKNHTETVTEVDKSTCPKVKDTVDLAAFESLDIRIGLVTDAKTILDREMTEKRGKPTPSRKLLQLKVDIGCEVRTVVSECRYVMDVEDAVGKKVLFVANVPATEVEGVESHGLILLGLNYDPTPMPRSFKLILPGLGRLPPGSQVLGAHIPR